jgi:membrane associated rhomboid family serine protease
MSLFGSGRGLSLPPVVKNIIIINVILFAATQLSQAFLNTDFMMRHLALFPVRSPLFEPHQIVTHMFMHGSIAHIFFNMFGVFMFGRILEQLWGSKKLLIFYTITGLGAALVHLTVNYFQISHMINMANQFYSSPSYSLFNQIVTKYFPGGASSQATTFMQQWFYKPDDLSFVPQAKQMVEFVVNSNLMMPTVGASGAVFGLLIAFAMLFPDVELMLIFLPIPIKAKYFVPFYALAELFFGVAGFKGDNIAHFAHLGGALFGFILVKIWKRNQFRFYK